jgi:hypothetical protein
VSKVVRTGRRADDRDATWAEQRIQGCGHLYFAR